jgi:hypothetical protein
MKQAIWNDIDLIKGAAYGSIIGFIIGVIVGYEWAWQPVVNAFKPLIG